MVKNKRLFQTTEFEAWAASSGLMAEEAFLVDRFLEKEARTLEAGVGGGRVLLALQRRGFRRLSGFDYVPELVARAHSKQGAVSLDLRVMEAARLAYPAAAFDQAIYFGQILCFIEEAPDRRSAVAEAWRVLRPGGVALFSFLVMEARAGSGFYAALLRYWKGLRALSGRRRSVQYQPWLRRGGRPNLAALLDRPPYVYWFTVPEALALLRGAGFAVEHVGTSAQLRAGLLRPPEADLRPFHPQDRLYVVCRKMTAEG